LVWEEADEEIEGRGKERKEETEREREGGRERTYPSSCSFKGSPIICINYVGPEII